MYVENEGGMKVTTSSLNEELGNVEFILSDKTGTLTKNNMRCFGFSMGGVPYLASDFENATITTESGLEGPSFMADQSSLATIQSLLERAHHNEPLSKLELEYTTDFLRALFLCNSVVLSGSSQRRSSQSSRTDKSCCEPSLRTKKR